MQGSGSSGGFLGRFFNKPAPATPAPTPQSCPQAPAPADTDAPQLHPEVESIGGRKRLLVYAPEATQRQRLEGLLTPWPHKWGLIPTSKTGAALIELIREQPVDGIVLLYREGAALVIESLQLLSREYPELPRFAVCPSSERASLKVPGALPPVVITTDATAVEFDERLTHAFLLNRWLMRPELRAILPRIQSLPTIAGTYQQVFEALLDPNYSTEEVGNLISRDPALTAQLLKVVNSAYFALPRPVQSVTESIGILGAARLQALVMSARAFCFIDEGVCPGFSPAKEWEHAVAVASTAQEIARSSQGGSTHTDTLFTAAMLHDLGKLLLAANVSEPYAAVVQDSHSRNLPLWQAEQAAFGFSHAELGACLLGFWGLPLSIISAIAWHHQPRHAPNPDLIPLLILHVADCQVRNTPPDSKVLTALGLDTVPPAD